MRRMTRSALMVNCLFPTMASLINAKTLLFMNIVNLRSAQAETKLMKQMVTWKWRKACRSLQKLTTLTRLNIL